MVAIVDTLHSGYLKLFEKLLGDKNIIYTVRGTVCRYLKSRYSKVPKQISVSMGA